MGLVNWLKGPECSNCGTHTNVKHKEEMGTMAGTVRWWYCDDCHKKKVDEAERNAKMAKMMDEKRRKEADRDNYYKWLKREVEIIELEKKAEQWGFRARERYDGQI